MNIYPKNYETKPLKLYIQDIFRAKRTPENKYIYELFGLTFKNIMIHGVVTSVYNTFGASTNLEISDPTGSVQVYFNSTKNNQNVPTEVSKRLHRDLTEKCRFGDENMEIKMKLLDAIASKKQNILNFEEGNYVRIVGDIFVDDLRETRMVSAYECKETSVEYDIVWLEELKYLYEKYYLCELKEN